MITISNVKILTLLQICIIVVIILFAWLGFGPQQTVARGTVDGILFTPGNPFVLVDGQVLQAGDVIYGVEIIEIGRRIVTFGKNGQSWEQRVRERPNCGWQEHNRRPETNTDNF